MKSVGGEGFFFFFWQNRGGFRDYFVWADFQSACLCSETLQSSGSLLHSINNTGSKCRAFYEKKKKKKTEKETSLCSEIKIFTSFDQKHLQRSQRKCSDHRKFISIFIVFRNPRIKSFSLFFVFLSTFTTGKNEGQARRHAFPSRRGALQDKLIWKNRRGGDT